MSSNEGQLSLPVVVRPAPESGEMKRDRSVRRVRGAHSQWVNQVIATIAAMPVGECFTTDDIWLLAPKVPSEPRAMGAAITDARDMGYIRATGTYRKSVRPACHARPVAVWQRIRAV